MSWIVSVNIAVGRKLSNSNKSMEAWGGSKLGSPSNEKEDAL